jgi:hypothetical protein
MFDVKVQRHKEYAGDYQGHEGQEYQLVEQSSLLDLNCEFVTLFRQFVTAASHQSSANIFHFVS